MTDAMTR